jgi:hypothetical protein
MRCESQLELPFERFLREQGIGVKHRHELTSSTIHARIDRGVIVAVGMRNFRSFMMRVAASH